MALDLEQSEKMPGVPPASEKTEQRAAAQGNEMPSTTEKTEHDEPVQTNGVPSATEKTEQGESPHPKIVPVVIQTPEQTAQRPDSKQSGGPEGGFDDTPVPPPPPGTVGYTLKFTMLRATDLTMGDAHVFSSDPFIRAQLNTDLPFRHREDPRLRFRTHTVRRNLNPEWNEDWIVANVPSSGFKLKIRIYDEDPADHDDMLGKVHVTVPSIDDDWKGVKEQAYRLTLRDSSKRALVTRAVANCFSKTHRLRGDVYLSIENLGRTGDDGQNGRVYTIGPCRWVQHHSPILGRLAHIKDPGDEDHTPAKQMSAPAQKDAKSQKKIERYNFQANQFQFPGPVPPELYHRFVEFKPWVRRMFTTTGFSGVVLGKALHHQHARVYNFDRTTVWGYFPDGPSKEMTQQFLDLVHYDKGGRIFTYVLTLDGLLNFTETGKEFGIDMLSKHTMHSDVSIYIAFSGEFFIRRIKHRKRDRSSTQQSQRTQQSQQQQQQQPVDSDADPISTDSLAAPASEEANEPKEPSHYELIIDNDSGTYRPNAALLPVLAAYLAKCLPGLHVKTLDCQADADEQQRLKGQQRERKKNEGDGIVYTQASDSSSISSSDEEELHEREDAYRGEGGSGEQQQGSSSAAPAAARREHRSDWNTVETVARDVKRRQEARYEKFGRNIMGGDREAVEKPGALSEHHHGAAGGFAG